jgi:hypothetical protein
VPIPVCEKLAQFVSVKDFGAVGDGVANDTAAIQAALDVGQDVYFPGGVYLSDPLTVPTSMIARTIQGTGFSNFSPTTKGVTVKARTLNQSHIFYLASGTDNVTFEGLRIDGDNKALKGIDSIGGFTNVNRCGVYDCVNYGFYSTAGLNKLFQCFFADNGTGAHIYSDSHVTDCEFTGGNVPLLIVAGGNRIVNTLANSGADCCVRLTPLNASTGHINTSITNCYFGEVYSGLVSKPVVEMIGLSAQKVQQVQFSNTYIVTAAAATDPKINGGVYMEKCLDVLFSNVAFLGNGPFATSTLYTDYFAKLQDSGNITFNGCAIRWANKNPIRVTTGCDNINVVGCAFDTWGSVVATGVEYSAIRIASGYTTITGCSFVSGDANPYAVSAYQSYGVNFVGNQVRYSNTTVLNASAGVVAGIWQRGGEAGMTLKNMFAPSLNFIPGVAPGSPNKGDVYYDSGTDKLYCWNGTSWNALF